MTEHRITRQPTGAAIVPSPVDAGIEPGRAFADPAAVLAAPDLTREEKRAILASWASDVGAVESIPALRQCPGAASHLVALDDILAALCELDLAAGAAGKQWRDHELPPRMDSPVGGVRWLKLHARRQGRFRWLAPMGT